jgi:arsenite methyltransferase
MSEQNHDEVRGAVRDAYGKVAQGATLGGCKPACCATASESLKLGYSGDDLAAVPEGEHGARLRQPAGDRGAAARARPCSTSAAAAASTASSPRGRSGRPGKVIGVDMTPDMVSKARANARKIAAHNVDFRLGEIEHLPVADGQVDVILSNCVINLSPDKRAVFARPSAC